MPNGLAGLHWNLRRVEGEVEEIREEVRTLRGEFQDYRDEMSKRREAEIAERKTDFRWRIGTSLAIISAILGAAAIVAGSFG